MPEVNLGNYNGKDNGRRTVRQTADNIANNTITILLARAFSVLGLPVLILIGNFIYKDISANKELATSNRQFIERYVEKNSELINRIITHSIMTGCRVDRLEGKDCILPNLLNHDNAR